MRRCGLFVAAVVIFVAFSEGPAEADYIVVEIARNLLGENWLPEYVKAANNGGIERVLV